MKVVRNICGKVKTSALRCYGLPTTQNTNQVIYLTTISDNFDFSVFERIFAHFRVLLKQMRAFLWGVDSLATN